MAVKHVAGNNPDPEKQVTPPVEKSNDDIKLDTDGERAEEKQHIILDSWVPLWNQIPETSDEQQNHEEKTEDECNRDAMRYSQLIKIRDCVFMTLQWMFSMPVKNINGKNPFLSQIFFMCMLLILGANGEEYEVRNMKNSLVSPKELLQISDNVVLPGFLYYYVYFNMGNTAFVCSKELAERNASCRMGPYASTSCQGWQYVSNGSTGYLAFNESKMPDFSNLLYCIYQAMPGVLTLYQGSVSRTPVDGGWGKWSSWGNCSTTCGGGKQYRHRNCNSPIPKYGGLNCSGNSSEERICKIQDCPNPWKTRFIIVLLFLLSALIFIFIVIGIKYYLWQKEKGNGKESAKDSGKYRRSRGDDDDSAVEV